MSFNDNASLYSTLAEIKGFVKRRGKPLPYAYYNFPLAFLLNGLLDFASKNKDRLLVELVDKKCNELLTSNGSLKFRFDKVDQAAFGYIFLKLYQLTGNQKYLTASHDIYSKIKALLPPDMLIRYRSSENVLFVDTIGLVCPFLFRYASIVKCDEAKRLAVIQIQYYLQEGIERNSCFPFHALDLNNKMPLGPCNWSRGVGWLLIGLSEYMQTIDVSESDSTAKVMRSLYDRLVGMKINNSYWPQFLGNTNDTSIDSSATLMFVFAFSRADIHEYSNEEILDIARYCVDETGQIVNASGDTIYINKYSRVKSASELSQGLMLSIMSRSK
ncbi:MAG: hypothetical protein CMF22_13360 [Idiomarinaceae bacterium]|nr:hypothetical protein [Idiomarinaceae bacterium]HCV05714.1 hypothetical protein [Pseudoalteromonas sp.]|tara:strand:+ start:12738 stop:13724 length:987 start_codon:yes stop_codon:yes gene_type:complete